MNPLKCGATLKTERDLLLHTREITRERGGMITTEEGYQMAQEKYLPRLIKAQLKDSLKRNDFDTYTLIQNLFSQEPAVKEAAWQDLEGIIIASEQGKYYQGKW
jgi:hypothetical protein